MIHETFYRCDPEKNTECRKTGCALIRKRGKKPGECSATKKAECAALSEDGRPVVAYVLMRGDDNGTD